MTRLHHPASIPGLLGTVETPGLPLVLDPQGNVLTGRSTPVDFDEVMKWQGEWAGGAYEEGDVVTDGAFLMVANKDTTDRPSPQPNGPPEDAVDPEPVWDTVSPTVTFLGTGTRFVFTEGGWVNSWRFYIPTISANNIYVGTAYDSTDPAHVIETSLSLTPTEVGWYEVLISPTIVTAGTDITLVLYAQNNAGFAPHTGPWDYTGQSQPTADPGAGNFNRNNSGTIVRINSTDQNALDRDGELAEITPGVELNVEDGEWIVRVNSSTDMGGWWEFNVTTQSGGLSNTADGVKQVYWEIANPQPTDYVKSDDYWLTNQPSWADVTGIYTEEPIDAGVLVTSLQTYVKPTFVQAAVEDDQGYGADFNFQPATTSDDWDIMAISGVSSGGSGGGGTTSNTLAGLDDVNLEDPLPQVGDLLQYQGLTDTALQRADWITSAVRTSSGSPDDTIDNNPVTEWKGPPSGLPLGEIRWDLGESLPIDKFKYVCAVNPGGPNPATLNLRYSDDPPGADISSWAIAATFNIAYGATEGPTLVTLNPITARYWGIQANDLGVAEFFLYQSVESWTSAEGFLGNTRGLALTAATPTSATWINFGSSLNLGNSPYGDLPVWITAQATASVLSSVGSSVYRMRVGISDDAGSSYTYGKEVWGTADGTSRRQAIAASHFLDVTLLSQAARVQVQVMKSSGGDPTFDEGTLTATMIKTSGAI